MAQADWSIRFHALVCRTGVSPGSSTGDAAILTASPFPLSGSGTMKKSLAALASIGLLGACTTFYPGMATSNELGTKKGEATCTSIIGLPLNSDCGIDAAAKNGNIRLVSHVDYKYSSLLGLYTTVTTTVFGQ